MCITAGAASIISAGVGAVTSGMAALQRRRQAKVQAQNEANAARRDAKLADRRGDFQHARTADDIARTQGAQRAAQAANGIALSGSALDTYQDSATEGQLDLDAIRFNSANEISTANSRADAADARARGAMSGAALDFVAPLIRGATSIAGAFNNPNGFNTSAAVDPWRGLRRTTRTAV